MIAMQIFNRLIDHSLLLWTSFVLGMIWKYEVWKRDCEVTGLNGQWVIAKCFIHSHEFLVCYSLLSNEFLKHELKCRFDSLFHFSVVFHELHQTRTDLKLAHKQTGPQGHHGARTLLMVHVHSITSTFCRL